MKGWDKWTNACRLDVEEHVRICVWISGMLLLVD